jgi:hypothetical protein
MQYNALRKESGPESIYFLVHICPFPFVLYPDTFDGDRLHRFVELHLPFNSQQENILSSLFFT